MKPIIFSILAAALPAGALLADTPDIWRSVGYGMILQQTADGVTIYQHSAFACLPLAVSDNVDWGQAGGRIEDLTLAGVGRFTDKMTVDLTIADAVLRADFDKVSPIEFRPIPALPAACSDPVGKGAAATFDVFWHFFNENYAYFERRGMDWDAVYATYRPQLDGAFVGRSKLKSVLDEVLGTLGDGHVNLYRIWGDEDYGVYPAWAETLGDGSGAFLRQLIGNHVSGDYVKVGEAMAYGRTDDNVGYILLAGMEGALVDNGGLQAAIGDMQVAFDGVDALVIDARYNTGGNDELGYALASYLTTQPVDIGTKDVFANGAWHDVMDLRIEPAADMAFDLPVYLFTSDMTISAGETFALALSHFDNVTIVGMPTHGTLSDMFYVALPNGWIVTLSNERYLDTAGHDFETLGVPVDIAVPINIADLMAGRDAYYDAMRAHLR